MPVTKRLEARNYYPGFFYNSLNQMQPIGVQCEKIIKNGQKQRFHFHAQKLFFNFNFDWTARYRFFTDDW